MATIAPTFGVLDYILFVIMLCISTTIGVFFACRGGRQKTSEEYLMADRNLPAFPVAMSLLASFFSAVSYLGIPAEVYTYGTMFWWFVVSHMLAIWIVTTLYMPVLYRLKLVSVNEYLELRFNKVVRRCGTGIFYTQRLLYLGIVVYAPCLALSTVTGIPFEGSVFLVAGICTFYTTIGGLKAVVWTDVFQMTLAFVGTIAIIIKGSIDFGGFSEIWRINYEGGRIDLWDFSPDPRIRHTVWSVGFGGTFIWLFVDGVNQYQVQRYLSCRTLNTARWSLVLYGLGLIMVVTLPCLVGIVIYAYYSNCDPNLAGKILRNDQIVAYLIIDIFRGMPGLPGLFVSSVFSAALSTMSSGLNSLAAITGEDIIKSISPNISEERYTKINKITVIVFAVIVTGLAFLADSLGKITQTAMSLAGIFGGPLVGMFSLGLFTSRANSLGTTVGFVVSVTFGLWVSIGAIIHPRPSASTQPLPVSISGCEEYGILNSTGISTTTEMTTMNYSMLVEEDEQLRSGVLGLYSISYSWYSCVFCTVTFVVGLVVSIITDWNHETKEVDPRLLSPLSNAVAWCVPRRWRGNLPGGDDAELEKSSTADRKYQEIALSENTEPQKQDKHSNGSGGFTKV